MCDEPNTEALDRTDALLMGTRYEWPDNWTAAIATVAVGSRAGTNRQENNVTVVPCPANEVSSGQPLRTSRLKAQSPVDSVSRSQQSIRVRCMFAMQPVAALP